MTHNKAHPLLTIDGVAKQLAVPESFVRRLVRERRIEFLKVGRYVRFEPTAVHLLVESARRS